MPPRDPIALVLGDDEDLSDVAEWDSRSVIDALSVVICTFLYGIKRYGLLVLAMVLFMANSPSPCYHRAHAESRDRGRGDGRGVLN